MTNGVRAQRGSVFLRGGYRRTSRYLAGKYDWDMDELSIVEIEELRLSVEQLPTGTTSNLTRETALEVLAQLRSVMLERDRLFAELSALGWR